MSYHFFRLGAEKRKRNNAEIIILLYGMTNITSFKFDFFIIQWANNRYKKGLDAYAMVMLYKELRCMTPDID